MRVDAHQVFNVSIQLCEFFNVDLSERGYYQLRLRPRKSSDMWSVDISHDPDAEPDSVGQGRRANNILLAHVYQGAAVSKTVEVTFQNEHFKLDDWFHISVQFNATLNLCEIQKLELEVELLHMDRYHPPQIESFVKLTKRVVEIPLDPTRLTAAARSLYFDTSFFSAVTICAFSSLVMVSTRQKRGSSSVEQSTGGTKSTKLRRVYNSSAHALLFSTRSIQQFIMRNSSLLRAPVTVAMLDVQEEMKAALLRFDNSHQPTRSLETDVSEWSTKITLIYQQMLVLFRKSNALRQQLLLVFDKQRGAVFREAFWLNERSIDEITIRNPISVLESYKSIVKVDYLKKLPRSTIYCEETDCPGEFCPIIFEDNYSRHPSLPVRETSNGEATAIPSCASMPAIKTSSDKHKSFREKLRKEASRLIHPRRKSLDCQQSLSRRVNGASSSRSRTKTLQETTTDGSKAGLLATLNREFQPEIKNGEVSPKCHSEPTASPSPSSEYGRCSAAGEPAQLLSKESVTSDEVASALRNSVSADDVLATSSDSATLTSSDDATTMKIVEENPRETMAHFELIRERDAANRILRENAMYDGVLYSDKSRKSPRTWPFSPVSSELVIGDPVTSISAKKIHLVVFVHGLEGSKDDLAPFKCGLEQAVAAHYHSLRNEHTEPPEEAWKFEYLMSNSNRNDTWLDITTMAHNLLAEVREYLEEASTDIHRISFMAHSLGGVIVRTAVGLKEEMRLEWLTDRCHTLLTINSPHLGLAYVQKHIHWGVQIVKWWKKSRSMEQLTFRDALDFTNSFVYKASINGACAHFKHVILIGTPHDQLVPYMSSLLVPSKTSSEDHSKFGESYREMMSALLNSMSSSEKTETLVRYTCFHQIGSTNSQKLAGRAAHVVALEDAVFIEKLFNVSAYKYFI